jgi:protein arginine kinase activator
MYFIHSIPAAEIPECPFCGISTFEIAQSSRVGCPECYNSLSGKLTPYIRRVHGPAPHTGNIPKSAGEHIYHKRRLAELQNSLHEAIAAQEFEKCAEIRDKIAELDGKGERQ